MSDLIHHTALSVITVDGREARAFLQSQLSGDINALKPGTALFTAFCNAQGRTLATFLVVVQEAANPNEAGNTRERLALITPTSLVEKIAQRLKMFVLRRQLTLTLSDERVLSSTSSTSRMNGQPGYWDAATQTHWWLTAPAPAPASIHEGINTQAVDYPWVWRTQDIEAGRVWIVAESYEAFVATTINVEAQGGISYTKGCYPGQEIIARTHYRGKAKRGVFSALTEGLPAMDINAKVINAHHQEIGVVAGYCPTAPASLALLMVLALDDAHEGAQIVRGDTAIAITQLTAHPTKTL